MFYIDQSSANFLSARENHYRNLRYVIKKKLMGKKFAESHPKTNRNIRQATGIPSVISTFLHNEEKLRDILIGTPAILNNYKGLFLKRKEKTAIRSLFNYEAFISKRSDSTYGFYNAYHLANNLKINTCVYCNRLYSHTVITEQGEKIIRPTFDHWFPKEEYPLLSLSFYNLIPCCSLCNSSIKGSRNYRLDQFFHPYQRHSNNEMCMDFKFSYALNNLTNPKCKVVANNKFSAYSAKAMRLEEMYSNHGEEIQELILLKKAYGNSYMQSLNSILKRSLSADEIYRLAFGTFIEDKELIKRPLSKLKKDILIELGVI